MSNNKMTKIQYTDQKSKKFKLNDCVNFNYFYLIIIHMILAYLWDKIKRDLMTYPNIFLDQSNNFYKLEFI